jgi:hypothetical protein
MSRGDARGFDNHASSPASIAEPAGERRDARNVPSQKKAQFQLYRLGGGQRRRTRRDGDVYPLQHNIYMSVRLSVCISRKTDAAGRQLGGGLRSKDDRELDIHTHTTRERGTSRSSRCCLKSIARRSSFNVVTVSPEDQTIDTLDVFARLFFLFVFRLGMALPFR